ncbi:tetrapyrrole methylase [Halteromyces radiatus]|uniref:tetrapyrrole methylase n=1 Tax=Halteromyces radiatus TaxID=101107 RepID=UPI00221F96E9|nr:tetrapyrrole methylase [Halteromyces radiatus]KAI8076813.1 tetrapyrrole methylase [Halteromyces radiatus]
MLSSVPITPNVPTPVGGASLMIAFQCQRKKMLVVGSNAIAASRVLTLLEADAAVVLIGDQETMVPELVYRIQQGQIHYAGSQWDEALLSETHMVFICQANEEKTNKMAQQCRHYRIPINVTDRNDLCDFFMTSTYRDQSLQIAVSTNGQASKLANRIRRHIISGLPAKLGQAVQRVGVLRKKIRQSDPSEAAKMRRMAWLAQICEYWSMDRLAQLSETDMSNLLETYQQQQDEGYHSPESTTGLDSHYTKHDQKGTITLVGSGPGDPSLLTLAAHQAIKHADLVLSDKIVPAGVVALVECELKIARKFPGNADAAQQEFNELALIALQQGKNVVRLKQGDPYLFGRGGEEVIFFRKHGYSAKVIPGISSAIAAPLLAGIPLTHRSVASQFLVTTGTGQKNSSVALPVFEPTRTDVFLMAIHRLDALVHDLINKQQYPADIPCAIVERASCDDQRVVYGTLGTISKVLESVGGSRPPGLLMTGHAINVLKQQHLPVEGVTKDLLLDDHLHQALQQSNLLQLHDPEGVY